MEKRMIIVSQVKSNRSDLMVWQVSINEEQTGMQHCTSPMKALRYCFLLKKQTGLYISAECLSMLSQEIARMKASQAEAGKVENAEVPQESSGTHSIDAVPAEQPEPKTRRKSRSKKSADVAAAPH